jgi:hypothetical protein
LNPCLNILLVPIEKSKRHEDVFLSNTVVMMWAKIMNSKNRKDYAGMARCKGKFPGPGIEKEGKSYCCDKCAKGSKKMLFPFVSIVLISIGLGFLTGSLRHNIF